MGAIHQNGLEAVKRIDYARPLRGGPVDRDSIISLVPQAVRRIGSMPTLDGNRIPVPPTHIVDRGPLPKHPYSRDNRPGMIASDFDLEAVDQGLSQEEPCVPRPTQEGKTGQALLPLSFHTGRSSALLSKREIQRQNGLGPPWGLHSRDGSRGGRIDQGPRKTRLCRGHLACLFQ